MSDLSPRDPTGDELASAYLDAVATPDERAAVEADARLGARVEELRAVRRALAAPVAARPAVAVDAAIAAALAAGATDERAPDETMASPRPLEPTRSGMRRRPVLLAVLGAAAAVVAVVTVAALRPSDEAVNRAGGAASTLATEQAATASAGADIAVATTAGAAPSTPAPAGGAATTAVAPAVASTATSSQAAGDGGDGAALPALGPIDAAADLRTALRPLASSGLSTADRSAPGVACVVADAAPVATVEWQGTPAVVFVGPGATAIVVNQSTCATLATVPLS